MAQGRQVSIGSAFATMRPFLGLKGAKSNLRGAYVALLVMLSAASASPVMPAMASGTLSMTGYSPISGPVGTVVTITGTGFLSGDVVAFNGVQSSKSTANKTGTKLKASVPAFATSGPVTVTDPLTGQTAGLPGSVFTVTTGIFASPSHVWAGGTLTLAGSNLTPDQATPIYIGTTQVGLAQTDRAGAFQVAVGVPWSQGSGRTSIYVVDPRYLRVSYIFFVLGDWPDFRHDALNSGYDNYETALSIATVGNLKTKWSASLGNCCIYGAPVVADGMVFAESDTALYAFNAGTGAGLWTFNTGALWLSSPTFANGIVYAASDNGDLYAVDAFTGTQLWVFASGGPLVSSPAVAAGTVYFGSNDQNVYALDAATGSKLWSFATGGKVVSSPSIAKGVVYVGSFDHSLYALKASTGSKLWSFATLGAIESSPAVVKAVVYFGSDDSNLYALKASTGAELWSFSTGGAVTSSPAVLGPSLYVGSQDGDVYGINASNGAKLWAFNTGGSVVSSPAIANGLLYVGATSSYLYALNISTAAGVPLLTHSFGGNSVDAGPAVSNGMVYVPLAFGTLYALGL